MKPFLLFSLVVSLVVHASTTDNAPRKQSLLRSILSRMYHFRDSGAGSFCSQWQPCPAGTECSIFHGANMYGLGICKKIIPLGYACSHLHSTCGNGSFCTNGQGGQLCRKMLSVGGNCTDFQKTICKRGMYCSNGYCSIGGGYGSRCDDKYRRCRKGYICTGKPGESTCKVLIKVGQKCGFIHGACDQGATCKKHAQYGFLCFSVMGVGATCTKKYEMCAEKLRCEGGRCRKLGAMGEVCTESLKCSDGLICASFGNQNKCVQTEAQNGECNGEYRKCASGLSCVGPSGKKQCQPPLGEGSTCSAVNHAYRFCGNKLQCKKFDGSYKCGGIVGLDKNCTSTFIACSAGLKCVGPSNSKKCRPAVKQGGSCASAYEYCAKGTTCQGQGESARCFAVRSLGMIGCGDHFTKCANNLECRSGINGEPQKCVARVEKGGYCDSGYKLCSNGLTCLKYGEHLRCVQVVDVSGTCTGTFKQCRDGSQCVGPVNKQKCVTKLSIGSTCNNSYLRCPKYLKCDQGKCVKFLARGATCTGEHVRCFPGLLCLPYQGSKKCYHPVNLGFPCNHPRVPFVVCKKNLVCYGHGINARCSTLGERGTSCEGTYRLCKKGLSCLGPKGSRKCYPLATKGERCGGGEYRVCKNGLVCYTNTAAAHGTCYAVHGYLERCSIPHIVCGPHLFCAGAKGNERCMKRKEYGFKCTAEEPCDTGLACISGYCSKVVGLADDCTPKFVSCGKGTVCAGLPHLKQCVKPMGLGGRCADDPYWRCGPNLKCVKGKNSIPTCVNIGNVLKAAEIVDSSGPIVEAIPPPKSEIAGLSALALPIPLRKKTANPEDVVQVGITWTKNDVVPPVPK